MYNLLLLVCISFVHRILLTSIATLLLTVTYPPEYPDEAPTLALEQHSDSPDHPLLDLSSSSEDSSELLSSLNATIEESMGTTMIYTLVMTLKESAENLITQRIKGEQTQRAAVAAKAEEEENRKFVGTPVNPETFLAWRDEFFKELHEAEDRKKAEAELDKKKRVVTKEEPKLTGKQLWERGLVGKLVDEDEDGEDGLEGVNIERLKVEA